MRAWIALLAVLLLGATAAEKPLDDERHAGQGYDGCSLLHLARRLPAGVRTQNGHRYTFRG